MPRTRSLEFFFALCLLLVHLVPDVIVLASSEAEICCRSSVCSGFCSSTSKTLRTQVFIVETHFRGGVKHLTFLHGSVGPVRRQRVWLLFAEKRLRHFTF